jgi:hypothetical protein
MKSALALITIGTLSAALVSTCDCAGFIAYVSQYAHTGWKLLTPSACLESATSPLQAPASQHL